MVSSVDIDVLLVSAISVWNRAIDAHRGTPPYQRILAGLHCLPTDRYAGIEVYEDDPLRPSARFAVRFRKGMIEPVAAEPLAEDVCWRVGVDYLERVVADADAYVQNPDRLDWSWVKQWAGIGS